MKKFMVMVVAMAFVMAANAATVTWSSTGNKAPDYPNSTFSGNNLSGGIAFLFYGAQDTAALDAAIQGGTFTGAGSLYSKATGTTGAITQANIGSYSNQDVTLYMVIFDKGTIGESGFYMISSDLTQTFTTANLTYAFTTANGRLPSEWTAVPEPTSMALLALGVAAVGLRRKFRK